MSRQTRTRLIATLLAAPAVVVAIAMTAIEVYRLFRSDATLFGGAPPQSLAHAITGGFGVERSYDFIRAGQDPNELVMVPPSDYTAGRTVAASPVMLAVAAQDSSALLMLFNFGGRV